MPLKLPQNFSYPTHHSLALPVQVLPCKSQHSIICKGTKIMKNVEEKVCHKTFKHNWDLIANLDFCSMLWHMQALSWDPPPPSFFLPIFIFFLILFCIVSWFCCCDIVMLYLMEATNKPNWLYASFCTVSLIALTLYHNSCANKVN